MYMQKDRFHTAKKANYNDYIYDSKFEAGYAQELDVRLKAGEITKWERQVVLHLAVNGFEVCTYRIDFVVYYPDGEVEYVELKGYAMPVWRLKWKLFEALYSDKPGVRLTVVKQRDDFVLSKLKRIK